MNTLLNELHNYHHQVAITIKQVSNLLSVLKSDACSASDCKKLFRLLDELHGDAERHHHENEELIRRALQVTQAPIHQRVKDIERDHHGFERIAEQLKALENSGQAPREMVAFVEDYIRKYFDHMDGEENIFFPMAQKWLTESQWQEVKRQWKR